VKSGVLRFEHIPLKPANLSSGHHATNPIPPPNSNSYQTELLGVNIGSLAVAAVYDLHASFQLLMIGLQRQLIGKQLIKASTRHGPNAVFCQCLLSD
jgi:hypothetical protein